MIAKAATYLAVIQILFFPNQYRNQTQGPEEPPNREPDRDPDQDQYRVPDRDPDRGQYKLAMIILKKKIILIFY